MVNVFSKYRAEWLGPEVFRLFTEPSYFPQLTTSHPCFLVGGRGTGKTTALRCLSYEGQAALSEATTGEVGQDRPSFVGMYLRINTNRVRAFSGPELDDRQWQRLFGHYVNMDLSGLVLKFLLWREGRFPGEVAVGPETIERLTIALHLGPAEDAKGAARSLDLSRLQFESKINNVGDGDSPALSMLGVPIDVLLSGVRELPQFRDTSFLFLLDEYENLDDSQQRVTNSLIKHCGEHYSFKVSVREFGFRQRSTLNDHEHLSHPADYVLIDIANEFGEQFEDFAARVCNRRVQAVFPAESWDVAELFPGMTTEEEGERLGVGATSREVVEEALGSKNPTDEVQEWLKSAQPLEIYVLMLRAGMEEKELLEKIHEAIQFPDRWRTQYGNYKYSYLFTIRKGKRGVRKHYAGWGVYCSLSSGNIRFLLELVDQAFRLYSEDGMALGPIDVGIQTEAAQNAGKRNLRELEGLSLNGAKLTRLLLSLGRVFQVMAANPVGHTPEVNQFHLSAEVRSTADRSEVESLVKEGIMHLALLRYSGSKLQSEADVRGFDYVIHPIFAPFFVFGHRRKRKIELSDKAVLGLAKGSKETIARLLGEQRRELGPGTEGEVEDLPDQMELFAGFYG